MCACPIVKYIYFFLFIQEKPKLTPSLLHNYYVIINILSPNQKVV